MIMLMHRICPMKYDHCLVVLCFVVSISMDLYDAITHILQAYFTGTAPGHCPCAGEVILKDMGKILMNEKFDVMDNYQTVNTLIHRIYPMKFGDGLVVVCFVVFILVDFVDLHDAISHSLQDCFTGTGAIIWSTMSASELKNQLMFTYTWSICEQ